MHTRRPRGAARLRGGGVFGFPFPTVPVFRSVPRPPLTHARSSQAYYKFASPAEIKELMLWVYPPKEEEVVEQRKLATRKARSSPYSSSTRKQQRLLEKKELFEALTASGYDDEEIEEMFEEYDQDGSRP